MPPLGQQSRGKILFALFLYSPLDPCYWSPFLLVFQKSKGPPLLATTGDITLSRRPLVLAGTAAWCLFTQKRPKCFTPVCSLSLASVRQGNLFYRKCRLEHHNCPIYSEKTFDGLSFTWPTPPLHMNQANNSDWLLQKTFSFVNSWSRSDYKKLRKYFSLYNVPEH